MSSNSKLALFESKAQELEKQELEVSIPFNRQLIQSFVFRLKVIRETEHIPFPF